jgi:uncharacterized protein YdbL (DUF1318 family)
VSARRAGGLTPRPLGISIRTTTAAALAAAVTLLLAVAPVLAHEGGPRLILEPTKVNAGGVVVIRGEDLALDEAMQLGLVGDTGQADLGAVSTDGEGHFTIAVDIPADTPVGTYAIQAVSASGLTVRSLVRLEGSPILGQEGAPPGQDEGFPAPGAVGSASPAAAPVATPVAAASAGSGLTPLSDPSGTAGEVDLVPIVALALALGALGLLVWRTRRPTASQAGSAELP